MIFIKVSIEWSLDMFILGTIIGEIPDDIGDILSPVIKLLVAGFAAVVTIAMILKYKRKRRENPTDPSIVRRNMIILLALYTSSALFASFDNLLGLKNLPYENAYLGTSISLMFTAIANGFYFWFVLQVLFVSMENTFKKKVYLMSFFLFDVFSTISSFLLKLVENHMYLIPLIMHVAASCFIFIIVLLKAFTLAKKIDDNDYRKKFNAISIGTCFGLVSFILFTVDAFSDHVTIYSIIGWLSLLALSYFLARGYY